MKLSRDKVDALMSLMKFIMLEEYEWKMWEIVITTEDEASETIVDDVF